ncbi:uDP-N-acetylenolpyruvoylglucosamine reductase [Clostridium sp. CAG:508]|nr:uDP-N-acetylenolpyruvoylglucosamine reductase [Clostridium sp. CAG:508]
MEKQKIYELLTNEIKQGIVKIDEPMRKHTNFKIGGNADVFVIAKNIEEIKCVIKFSKENNILLTILGNGSNVLVSDKGIRGIVLQVGTKEIKIEKQKNALVEVEAGVMLGALAQVLLKQSISGFEFAAGIPGSIGGAIRMNAGAYGGEMKDIVKDVTVLNEKGEISVLTNEECEFSYRHSRFTDSKEIVIKVTLKLPLGNEAEIKAKMDEYDQSRREKQPLNLPSAGSTFKRGSDFITAKLIDECGLKGYTSGDAQVSTLHAGFVVNLGNATAQDVLNVVNHVKQVVLEKTGKQIELEVELLGEGI